jgi:23S rRNA (uracil1939-C5)-methyltransferase
VRLVLDAVGPGPGVALDLYSGVGVFAVALARAGWTVTAVEADREAVAAGRLAASRATHPGSVRFVASPVQSFLDSAGGPRPAPEVVVADPPRSGLGRDAVGRVSGLGPRRIVLVSCDPATLARDARGLVDRGYALGLVSPVDLFPQTAQVEAVAVFDRQ